MADRRAERLANRKAIASGAAEAMTERIPLKKMAKKAAVGAAVETMTERLPIKKMVRKRGTP